MNGLVLVLAVILNPHAKREAEHEEHRSCEDTHENPHDSDRHACSVVRENMKGNPMQPMCLLVKVQGP